MLKTLNTYKNQFGNDHPRTAWIFASLGSVYENMEDYKSAKELMEQALEIYKKRYGEECTETAWVLGHLGSIYSGIGDNIKSLELLERSLKIYYSHFEDNHINITWIKLLLANVHLELKNYQKSGEILDQVYKIHHKIYGANHIRTAYVLYSQAKLRLVNGDLIAAEDLINEALNIFQQNHHPKAYMCLEFLGDLYTLKAKQELDKGNNPQYKLLNDLAVNHYKKALDIIEIYFTNETPKLLSIKAKLNAMKY